MLDLTTWHLTSLFPLTSPLTRMPDGTRPQLVGQRLPTHGMRVHVLTIRWPKTYEHAG
jgi:hypothetical protein